MSDPADLALIGGGGTVVGGLLMALLKWSGSRNISHLDGTIKALGEAVTALSKEIQALREANVGLAKDVGALQAANVHLQQRIDGQAEHWRKQFEEYRVMVHERLDKATHDMVATVEQVAETATRRRK